MRPVLVRSPGACLPWALPELVMSLGGNKKEGGHKTKSIPGQCIELSREKDGEEDRLDWSD